MGFQLRRACLLLIALGDLRGANASAATGDLGPLDSRPRHPRPVAVDQAQLRQQLLAEQVDSFNWDDPAPPATQQQLTRVFKGTRFEAMLRGPRPAPTAEHTGV